MARSAIGAAAFAAIMFCSSAASAGVYTDDLGKCLVSSTNDSDKQQLVQWIFGAIAMNPSIKPYANISAEQRQVFDRNMAAIVERLLFNDCRKATVDALKYEGESSLEASFGVLGGVASRSMFNRPETTSAVSAYSTYIDKEKLAALFKEAGISAPNDSASTPSR